ncbi:MAG: hypothetical protein ACI8RD_006334, partial [Bacillariaceae sp.]
SPFQSLINCGKTKTVIGHQPDKSQCAFLAEYGILLVTLHIDHCSQIPK